MRGWSIIIFFVLVVGVATAGASAATEQWEIASSQDPAREDAMVVVAGHDERMTISMHDDSVLRITTDDGEEQVIEFDLSLIEDVVAQAMVGMQEALADLSDLQIDIQVDPDESVVIGHGDEIVEVDLQEIMAEVNHVLAAALQDLDLDLEAGFHRSSRSRSPAGDEDADELEQLNDQLDQLRDEVSRLRAELRRLKRDQQDLRDR